MHNSKIKMIIKIKVKINKIFYLNYYMKLQQKHYFLQTDVILFLMLSNNFQELIHIFLNHHK